MPSFTGRWHPERGLLVAVVLAVVLVRLATVLADDGANTGLGSPEACKSANVTGTIDGGGGDMVTVPAGAGNVIDMICIKAGQAIFPLLGTGDCANVATNTNGDKSGHSHCITANGQYADGPCYMVSGIGTAKVTVTRKPASCPQGSGISHVDFLTEATPTVSKIHNPQAEAAAMAEVVVDAKNAGTIFVYAPFPVPTGLKRQGDFDGAVYS